MPNKQQIGAAKRKLRKTLEANGVKPDAVDAIIASTFGGESLALKSIPRGVTKQMLASFNKGGKGTAVSVAWCKSGKFRVYTADAYNNLVAHGRKLGKRPRAKKK